MASLAGVRADLRRLQAAVGAATPAETTVLEKIRRDPSQTLALTGTTPDPWQRSVLSSASSRSLLLCSRQAGKSTVAAALALNTALLTPRSLTLLLSPTERQSSELMKKVLHLYDALGKPVPATRRMELTLSLANGSRVVALPGKEQTIRCYSGVTLLVIDEAARVPDALYYSVRPMLAVSRGKLVALSTPFGKRGFFFAEYTGSNCWERTRVKATDCPRITREFLAEERASIGERWFRQEYETSFEEVLDSVFAGEDIAAALSGVNPAGEEPRPLFTTEKSP